MVVEKAATLANATPMAHHASDDEDDGFGDFLSEDEAECALQTQEMAALERRMKTVRDLAGVSRVRSRTPSASTTLWTDGWRQC